MPRVEVNRTACTGCGVCVETCPPDVLRMDEQNKAVVAYPDDCQGCFVCQWDCKFEALRVRLRRGPEFDFQSSSSKSIKPGTANS